jgi:hypothetical protein
VTNIPPAPGKEDTCSQVVFIIVFAGNRAGDSGLSSTSHAVQPEDVPFITLINLCHYLLEDADSSVGEAIRVVPLIVRVEGCLGSRQ